MARQKTPRHKHTFELFSVETTGPDSKGMITVVTTWKCSFLAPVSCTRTRVKKQKNRYFRKRGS